MCTIASVKVQHNYNCYKGGFQQMLTFNLHNSK